ncbi:amino acid ABC transporter permease [Niallia alba]|uniref:Amino acid ABC transporter permease n=1 Tax=Niallia circulans TaxID=1397 RepID=A0A941GE94_NIACI|nr:MULTISPECIES: amino acid ABC transporter permease [Niallia]MCB5238958.1 amino acid ABC transporter permease [Niallia circulans]MDU1845654.1 amino acid ABC transporter permease [Niallia nealsonii]MED3795508.1 amino acid ABC transporter permease [Niallia alba]
MLNSGISVLLEGNNLERLLNGLFVTLYVAFIAAIISIVLGFIIGIIRTSKNKLIQIPFRIYLELFRIIPILVWLFVIYYILPANFGLNLSSEVVALLVFSLWGIAEMSDIVRGAIISLPKHQMESSKALGLSIIQMYGYVLIPQALKRSIPPTINLITRMVKTTALLTMIGVIEVIKVGQQIIEVNNRSYPIVSFWIYGFIFFLYFCICFPLSRFSRKLEKKWAI